jgi:hypothetical protein
MKLELNFKLEASLISVFSRYINEKGSITVNTVLIRDLHWYFKISDLQEVMRKGRVCSIVYIEGRQVT